VTEKGTRKSKSIAEVAQKCFPPLLTGAAVGLPTSFFRECNHCGKFIVLTRSDKRYCPGCAAKKNQRDKWRDDPEGMKLKEKIRYHTKRRQSD